VTGGWRKLHNEELNNLYTSSSTIRIMKSRRTRGVLMRVKLHACRLLVAKPEEIRRLGIPRGRRMDNIKMGPWEGWSDVG
jgi:hypothetical protein